MFRAPCRPCCGADELMPALLTRMSIWPSSASAQRNSSSTLARSATSTGWISIGGPAFERAATSRSFSIRRPAIATRQPSAARARAIPSPMPVPPPVTSAVFPVSFIVV